MKKLLSFMVLLLSYNLVHGAADSRVLLVNAIIEKNVEAVRSLLKSDVEPDFKIDKLFGLLEERYQKEEIVHGETLLSLAHDNLEILQLLFEHGALPDKDSDLYLALSRGHSEVMKLLFKNGARYKNIFPAFDREILNSYLFPLPDSRQIKMSECMELILAHGFNINAQENDEHRTWLHLAISIEQCPVLVRFLLDQWADLNIKDDEGDTPLMSAKWWLARNPGDEDLKKIVKMLEDEPARRAQFLDLAKESLDVDGNLPREVASIVFQYIVGTPHPAAGPEQSDDHGTKKQRTE